jgi:hypothetical protein
MVMAAHNGEVGIRDETDGEQPGDNGGQPKSSEASNAVAALSGEAGIRDETDRR